MGNLSKRLHQRLAKHSGNLPTEVPPRRPDGRLPGNAKDMETLIKEGLDPVHAAYAYIQQITARFAEGVSQFPEMKEWSHVIEKLEEEYMPLGPPMSPLTHSYFTTWFLYDFRLGGKGDTLAECQIEANDIVWMNPDQLDALKKQAASRMGVYEHIGMDGPYVRLRELITGEEFACHVPSGYQGRKGELWYVRLLPPLMPELATFHIAFTTPYILIHTKAADWRDYLKRSLVLCPAKDERESLHRLMKYGPDQNYWHEFVFKAYHHHQHDAVFLAGIPDLKDTLPHA